jgi:hypothetical protein
MCSGISGVNDPSIDMREAILAAWLQDYLPFLLSDPDETAASKSDYSLLPP